MKSIDFSKPGGFPLTQDQLGYMQSAYTEALTALASVGVTDNSPCIIKGCEVSIVLVSGYLFNYSIADGWIFYSGNMMRVTAHSINVDVSVNAAYIESFKTSSAIAYNDGTVHESVFTIYGKMKSLAAGTLEDTDHFLLKNLLGKALMPVPVFSSITMTPDGQTIFFTKPQTIFYNVAGIEGVNTITLNSAFAKEGCEVSLFMRPPATGMSVTFIKGGLEQVLVTTGNSSLSSNSPSHPLLIKIKIVAAATIPTYIIDSYVL